jgi:hypothetical protein
MQNLIDEQLGKVLETHPYEKLVSVLWRCVRRREFSLIQRPQSYLVLSGGLGSSPYVRQKMKERYGAGGTVDASAPPINARGMRVLLSDTPQLAVVHGLVRARIQRAKRGVNVFSKKVSPISVGVLCRRKYNEKEHQGEDVALDPFDKKRWAERQIEWIIKRGDVVDANQGLEHKYRHKVEMGREHEPPRLKVVTSTSSARRDLPKSLPKTQTGDGVSVCDIVALLDRTSLRRKNHRWYHLRKEYNLAEFSVRLKVGAGLKFEILNKDGRCAHEHEEIPVRWESVKANHDPDGRRFQ